MRSNTALRKTPELLPTIALLLAVGCATGRTEADATAPEPAPGPAGVSGAAGASGQQRSTPAAADQEAAARDRGAPAPGTALLVFGNDTVLAEVASTPGQRSQGLMGRASVPSGTGMLFVFDDEEVRSFWMQNTLVSLDIAFFDSEFRIVDIQQMEARSEDFHDSRQPAMYALEVPEGWFASRGIRVGERARVVFGR